MGASDSRGEYVVARYDCKRCGGEGSLAPTTEGDIAVHLPSECRNAKTCERETLRRYFAQLTRGGEKERSADLADRLLNEIVLR